MKKLILFAMLSINLQCFALNFSGVPPEIVESIEKNAVKLWPEDYQMQNYSIKSDLESYRENVILKNEINR